MGTAIADAILKYKVDAQGGVGQIAQNSTSNAPKEIIDDKTREVVSVDIPSKENPENKIEEKTKEIPSKEEIKTVVVEKPKVDPEQSNPDKLVYKVQLMASSRDLPLVSDNFKGLSQITKEPYNKLFRYLYGSTLSYREAKMLQSKAARIGYPSAYIVAYKQGERVAVPKELQEDSQ